VYLATYRQRKEDFSLSVTAVIKIYTYIFYCNMMQQVYKTLPDDRPIMSINVIEDPDKCPTGFVVVSTFVNTATI
jgi:hypothetical protein